MTIGPDGKITDVNRATEKATGVPRERIVGTDFADYFTVPDAARAGYQEVLARGDVRDYPLTLRNASGGYLSVLYNATVFRNPSGEVQGVFAAARDVTALRKAQEALRESEARFRLLASEAPVGIFMLDTAGRCVYANPFWRQVAVFEANEPVDDRWEDAIHPEDRDRLRRERAQAVSDGRTLSTEYRFLARDGRVTWVRGVGTVLRGVDPSTRSYLGVTVDVTAARLLQEQLAVTSRLASLGTLVAGVAHEINNPLASEIANQGTAIETPEETLARVRAPGAVDRAELERQLSEVVEALRDVQEAGQRIAHIVRDMALFARPERSRSRVRLAEVVDHAMRWLPASVANTARVQVESDAPPDVVASEGQLIQVIVNLVTNAAKAMRGGNRGTVTIRTGPGAPGMARIEVSDDGVGMSPEVMKRIFDPFFTTRPTGHGMGLGLPVVHSIVTAHGGAIGVTTQPGCGTTVRVDLPAET